MSDQEVETSTVVEDETDFEAAFKEHAVAKEGPDDELEDDATEELDKEEIKDQETGTETGDEPGEKEKAQSGEPGDKENAGAQDDLPEDLTAEEKELYESLPGPAREAMLTLRDQNKNLNHRLNSDAGRVSAFQRKINGLEKEIQSIRQGATTGSQPSTNQIADAMKGTDEEWEQFSEDYPEVARAIDSRLDMAGKATQETIESTLAPVKETQAKLVESEQKAAIDAASAPVTEAFPTWKEAVQEPDFKLWLDEQPPGVQSLTDSDEPADAKVLIGLYDDHLVADGKPSLKAKVPNEDVPGPGDDKAAEAATKLAAKRQQQLEDGTTIKSKSSGIDPGKEPVDDFEAAFNFHANRKERSRRAG